VREGIYLGTVVISGVVFAWTAMVIDNVKIIETVVELVEGLFHRIFQVGPLFSAETVASLPKIGVSKFQNSVAGHEAVM
jgi:hypothetical protein